MEITEAKARAYDALRNREMWNNEVMRLNQIIQDLEQQNNLPPETPAE